MTNITFCFILLHIISLTKLVKGQEVNDLCNIVRVQSEIWAFEKLKDSIKFVRCELWSEYNHNEFRRPIPDTIITLTKLMLPVTWMGEQLPKDSVFYLKTTMQLKYGNYDDCIDVINPKLTKEIPINHKKLSYQTIEKAMNLKGIYILKSNPILIRKYMIENDIGFFENNKQNKFLCQIIINTYLGYKEDMKDCLIEHIHPVCALFPRNYILNEW